MRRRYEWLRARGFGFAPEISPGDRLGILILWAVLAETVVIGGKTAMYWLDGELLQPAGFIVIQVVFYFCMAVGYFAARTWIGMRHDR